MSRFAGQLHQIGIVVTDLDRAIEHWTRRLGVGPFAIVPEVQFENYRYRGDAMKGPTISIAVAQDGPLQIEIIKQHDEVPSAYLEYLKVTDGGLQHLSAWPDSRTAYDEHYQSLLNEGFEVIHQGNVAGFDVRFSYFGLAGDPESPLLEISEANIPEMKPVWIRLKQLAQNWDGTEPVRNLGEILT